MKAHASQELAVARHHLSDARSIMTLGLAPVAAREAYLAAFHAAQAFVYDRTGRLAKTHRGLRAEFTRLARDESGLDQAFPRFLANAYELKSVADYGMEPSVVSVAAANVAIETAERMIAAVAGLLGPVNPADA